MKCHAPWHGIEIPCHNSDQLRTVPISFSTTHVTRHFEKEKQQLKKWFLLAFAHILNAFAIWPNTKYTNCKLKFKWADRFVKSKKIIIRKSIHKGVAHCAFDMNVRRTQNVKQLIWRNNQKKICAFSWCIFQHDFMKEISLYTKCKCNCSLLHYIVH